MQKDDHLVILKVNTVSIYFLCEGPLLLPPHAIFVAVMDILKVTGAPGQQQFFRCFGPRKSPIFLGMTYRTKLVSACGQVRSAGLGKCTRAMNETDHYWAGYLLQRGQDGHCRNDNNRSNTGELIHTPYQSKEEILCLAWPVEEAEPLA